MFQLPNRDFITKISALSERHGQTAFHPLGLPQLQTHRKLLSRFQPLSQEAGITGRFGEDFAD